MNWSKQRSYSHFDNPIPEGFAARVLQPGFAARHSFSPLIRNDLVEHRYRKTDIEGERARSEKRRPIYRASHRDACLLGYWATRLSEKLEASYAGTPLAVYVGAYRSPDIANYTTANRAFQYAKANERVDFLTFDVTAFFDSLNHSVLKARWKKLLGVTEMPEDDYAIFRSVTKFSYVEQQSLHSASWPHGRWSIRDMKTAGVLIQGNPTPGIGIPQGLPISPILSNIYMTDFDTTMASEAEALGAFYSRYGDDICIICKPEHAALFEAKVRDLVREHHLSLNDAKLERRHFDWAEPSGSHPIQYLGFEMSEEGVGIRRSTLSRNWQKMLSCYHLTRDKGIREISAGGAQKVFTRKFRRKFCSTRGSSSLGYALRASLAFGDDSRIEQQVRRLRLKGLRLLPDLNRDISTRPGEDYSKSDG